MSELGRRAFFSRLFSKGAAAITEPPHMPSLSSLTFPKRQLGRTGEWVPILGFGTASMGRGVADDVAAQLLNHAVDLGVNYIDTAAEIGGYGRAQKQIGRALAARRKEIFLVTKLFEPQAGAARKLLENNLQELRTDHVDLLYVHSLGHDQMDPDVVFSKNGVFETVMRAKEEGLTRYVGVSGHNRPARFMRALADYDRAIALNPKDPSGLLQRANFHLLSGDADKALADYNAAIALDPKNVSAFANRGEAYRVQGEDDRAIADFDAALKLDPKFVAAYDNRGLALLNKGETDRAIADFDAAIKLSPNLVAPYSHRAIAYEAKGAHDRALADFAVAIKLDPNDPTPYVNRGNIYLSQNDLDRALEDYGHAIMIDANDAEAYNNRGSVYAKKGDFTRAVADYDAAIRLNPQLAGAYGNRGLALVKAGQYARAIADFNVALSKNPKDALSLYNRGFAKQQTGDQVGGDIDAINARAIDPNVGK